MDQRDDAGPSTSQPMAESSNGSQHGWHSVSAPISGSDDLLSIFGISDVYDRYVRPYLKVSEIVGPVGVGTGNGSGDGKVQMGGDLKGKGKAVDAGAGPGGAKGAAAAVAAAAAAAAAIEAKKTKMEKSYGFMVADIGGKNSIKKDHFLRDLCMNPNWTAPAEGSIQPIPPAALRDAFTLLPGALPGFDTSHWVAEEGGPKRKRKRRKHDDVSDAQATPTNKEEEHRKKKRPRNEDR